MKYITSVIFGFILVGVLSITLTPLLSDAYISFYDLEAGPDAETELFMFLLYVQWPLFFATGFASGYLLHSKIISRKHK
ncbi:MAG: hypothetical protein CMI14_08050 [Oleispira sp.]|nr:hypothetical protein [Oleispira sp.]|tara:strand:- start:288 stop:524 length:237 start_codon:yes stop_codon:yes gene_type:complete